MASQHALHAGDYVVFAATLLISLGIGVYHSMAGGKQKTTEEYLLGNRQMSVVPVAMSFTVSYISTILLLGYPAEIYSFGGQIVVTFFGTILGVVLTCVVFIPLLYPLKFTSVNEYLEKRFKSRLVKYLGSFFTITSQIFYCANVYFGPSTALEAVTGFPAWLSITIGSIVSILYTTIGGIKAVIWTDVFQSAIMFSGLLAIVIQGIISVGGLDVMWEINKEWGRLDVVDFDVDPTKRMTLWGAVIGRGFLFMGVYGYIQPAFQRYSSMPTIRQAKLVTLGTLPGTVILAFLAYLSGWTVFAYYTIEGCDPLQAGYITNPNQVIPYFVMEIFEFPGLPGLFIAALSAASLSSASSALNAASANAWEDIVKPLLPSLHERGHGATATKIIVVVAGVVATLLAFCIIGLGGTVVQIMGTFASVLDGPAMALFLTGALFPWINWIGMSIGCLVGVGFGLWISLGSYTIKIHLDMLPTNTENCTNIITNSTWVTPSGDISNYIQTTPISHYPPDDTRSALESLYSISFLWLPLLNCIVVLIVSFIISLITGLRKPGDIEAKYVHPIVRKICKMKDMDCSDSIDVNSKSQMPIKQSVSLESLQRLYNTNEDDVKNQQRVPEEEHLALSSVA